MQPKKQNLSTDFEVGTCPACQKVVHGTVDVEVEVKSAEVLAAGKKVTLNTQARIMGMRLDHECSKYPQPAEKEAAK